MTLEPEARSAGGPDAEQAPPTGGPSTGGDDGAPGFFEAIGDLRGAVRRLIDAHLKLLQAELAVIGRQIGVIAGLAAAIVALAILAGLLLVIGGFLFLGEWLFGSMGWGIIHGTLLAVTVIGFAAVDLAGGSVRSYTWGVPIGLVVTILVSIVLILNLGNEAAEAAAGAVEDPLRLDTQWAPTLVGFVVGAVVLAGIALFLGHRSRWRFGSPLALGVAGALLGGFIGAILASTRYDAPDGVVGLAIALGFITAIVVGWLLAARHGFDPESRYGALVPRATMEAAEETRSVLEQQLQRQKDRFMGR